MSTKEINRDILRKKKELNAVILAHNYQSPEIHAIADIVGDSLELALAARDTCADILIICGVVFMAETAKILNPEKRVFIPIPKAGCPLADYLTPDMIRKAKVNHPDAKVVVYVNSSAACKSEADIVCTSGNAEKIVRSLPNKDILFGPDANLADHVQMLLPEKQIIPMPKEGHCYVHQSFTLDDISQARNIGGKIMAHPECPQIIRASADIIASTGKMIQIIQDSGENIWHIFTEEGMVKRLKTIFPDKIFYHPLHAVCKDMKKTTLNDIRSCLYTLQGEIILDTQTLKTAKKSLERMLAVQ
jgi:quinolinate synthase